MSATALYNMLKVRYPAPAWALLFEVAPFTGLGGGNFRYADAVALGLHPSRGIALHGFEVKISRSDLRKELEDPTKADAVGRYCDYWWLVVASEDLADGVEVPETWGVLAPRRGVLHPVKKAPKRERQPWRDTFVCSLIRRFSEGAITRSAHQAALDDLQAKLDARVDAGLQSRVRDLERERDHWKASCASFETIIEKFQRTSGVRLNTWEIEEIGAAVGALTSSLRSTNLRRRLVDDKRVLERMAEQHRDFLASVEAALVALDRAPAPSEPGASEG